MNPRPLTPEQVAEIENTLKYHSDAAVPLVPFSKYREHIEQLRAEISRVAKERDEVQFRPTGDNHHNAARCPYCRSQTDAGLRDQLIALKQENAELRADMEEERNAAQSAVAGFAETIDGLRPDRDRLDRLSALARRSETKVVLICGDSDEWSLGIRENGESVWFGDDCSDICAAIDAVPKSKVDATPATTAAAAEHA